MENIVRLGLQSTYARHVFYQELKLWIDRFTGARTYTRRRLPVDLYHEQHASTDVHVRGRPGLDPELRARQPPPSVRAS
jgi:hypothetical protein